MVIFSLFTLSTWSFRNGCKAKTDQSCNGYDDGSEQRAWLWALDDGEQQSAGE